MILHYFNKEFTISYKAPVEESTVIASTSISLFGTFLTLLKATSINFKTAHLLEKNIYKKFKNRLLYN